MLDLGLYLLGGLELGALAGFALLGASALRSRLVPELSGPPAWLATLVLSLALLLWIAELLGTVGLFQPLPLVLCVAAVGIALHALLPRVARWRGSPDKGSASLTARGIKAARLFAPRARAEGAQSASEHMGEGHRGRVRGQSSPVAPLIGWLLASALVAWFAVDARPQLGHGMTGFDSTWYHGPFAAGFFADGDTWSLHLIAPQFLAWFYPANSEAFHAIGMLAFERDLLSPLLNVGWFAACLLALWCIGRPFGVPLLTLVLGAIALRLPAFADQAGEARNDIVGTFFLLAATALALNAPKFPPRRVRTCPRISRESANSAALVGLAVGMAAGTKLNFLLPAAVLVFGLALVAPRGARARSTAIAAVAAVAGGGYWYVRNLAHAGSPLPWIDEIGPISLPAPDQPLGGREGHSVLGYLTDGTVWADWLLPGFHDGLGLFAPLVCALAAAGIVLGLLARSEPALRLAAAAALATALAWLVAPTSASGPEGLPRGFESGLRYLIPALTLGLAILPLTLLQLSPPLRQRLAAHSDRGAGNPPDGRILKVPASLGRHLSDRGVARASLIAFAVATAIAIGYPVQRHYLEGRYADPSFTAPGLNAAFAWARDVSDARIATTSTRQYPLFGTDLSNTVEFVGVERPHGGFVAPATCPEWRRLLNEDDYDYVVASRDRIEPERPPFPPTARWTEGPGAKIVLKDPPTVVFELRKPLDVSACQRIGHSGGSRGERGSGGVAPGPPPGTAERFLPRSGTR